MFFRLNKVNCNLYAHSIFTSLNVLTVSVQTLHLHACTLPVAFYLLVDGVNKNNALLQTVPDYRGAALAHRHCSYDIHELAAAQHQHLIIQ